MNINKRITAFILVVCAAALSGCGRSSAALQIQSGKDITFFISSDVHYLSKRLTDGGEAYKKFVQTGDGMQLNYIDEISDAFVNDVKKKKPNILIISGDLTTNGEKESHIDLAKKLKVVEDAGTAVYVIPGNHDIFNPHARSFKGKNQNVTDYISDKDFSKIYADFGYNEAVSRDKNTLSYLAAPSKDVWLLMLDTAQYKNNLTLGYPQGDGEISSGTLEWIKKCSNMARENHAQIIAVMHHNLMNHSDIVNKGFTINNSKEALNVFRSCGIRLALSGHIHLQDIKSSKEDGKTIYDIASSALGIYPQKYGILKYSPGKGYDYTTSRIDVEEWSKEARIQDKNLNNFKTYSRDYYYNSVYETAYNRLLMDDDFTIEQIKLMSEISAEVKLKYFEGTKITNKDEIINSQGFKLLAESGSDRSLRNLQNMLNADDSINNKLHIPDNRDY